jgi:hypothetical protein
MLTCKKNILFDFAKMISETNIIKTLKCLIDNIFVMCDGRRELLLTRKLPID